MFCNPFVNAHCSVSCCNRNSRLLRKFCKNVCGLCSSRLKSATTSSDIEGLPRDFSFLALPVRTNHDIWPDILAYKRLQNTGTLRLRSSIAITWNVLFNRINHFQSSLPSTKTKFSVLLFWSWVNENYFWTAWNTLK